MNTIDKSVPKKSKSTKKKPIKKKIYIKKTKKKSISTIGFRDEESLYKSLIVNNYTNIVKWICNNLDIVLDKKIHNTKDGKYVIYKVGRTNPTNKLQKRTHIYIIRGTEQYGKGTWGTVTSGYIFEPSFYTNSKIMDMALDNRRRKLKGYVNKTIINESQAFWLLLKNDETYLRWIISKAPKYAIKIPNDMETDGETLKDILYDPVIQSIIGINKNVSNYIPKLQHIFLVPKVKKWKTKCKKKEQELPNSIIISIMEQLDGCIEDLLNNQLKAKKKIKNDIILSYLLQISIALYDLYKIDFNHRDLKTDNTMYNYNENDKDRHLDINMELPIEDRQENISFSFPTFGYTHKIIDLGLSCIKYKEYQLNSETYYNKKNRCVSRSRDLTLLVFSLLNFYHEVFSEKILGYFGYLLEISPTCSLVHNLYDPSYSSFSNESLEDNSSSSSEIENEHCNKCGADKYISKGINSTEIYVEPILDSENIEHIHDNINTHIENRKCVACGNLYTAQLDYLPCNITNCNWDGIDNNYDSINSYSSGEESSSEESSINDFDTMEEYCEKIDSWSKKLYNMTNLEEFDNKKTYPEQIIFDIYNYTITGNLPNSKEVIKILKS